jgi:hypothetical protein
VVVVAHPNAPGPTPAPTPTKASTGSPETPTACPGSKGTARATQNGKAATTGSKARVCRPDKPVRPHDAKPPKAKHHQSHQRSPKHHEHKAEHHQPVEHQQAMVDKSQRGHKSGRRLRIRRRAR